MNEYTEEPWVRFYCEGVAEILPAGRLGTIATGLSDEDAKRIIACVHACRGLSTDLLYELKPGQLRKLWLDHGVFEDD